MWKKHLHKTFSKPSFICKVTYYLYVQRQRLARCPTSKVKMIPIRCKPSEIYTAPLPKPFTPPPSIRCITKERQIIFTCVSSWCEWSACSQMRFGSFAFPVISSDDCPQCQWLWCGQHCKLARLDWYCCGFHSPKAAPWTCTGWTERMEHVLLVGGRLCVSWDVLSEFVSLIFLPAQQFFSASFVLSPLFCRNWCHQCWGLNCCHSTQLNHLVCSGGFALYPWLWGMGARPFLWLISAHRPWGVFTRLSGDRRGA